MPKVKTKSTMYKSINKLQSKFKNSKLICGVNKKVNRTARARNRQLKRSKTGKGFTRLSQQLTASAPPQKSLRTPFGCVNLELRYGVSGFDVVAKGFGVSSDYTTICKLIDETVYKKN